MRIQNGTNDRIKKSDLSDIIIDALGFWVPLRDDLIIHVKHLYIFLFSIEKIFY